MTEWEQVKKEMDDSPYFDGRGYEYPMLEIIWLKVKAVGDKLQTENRHVAELYGIQVDRTHVLQQKIETIRTGLLELIEHGYITHCVTDVMNLLDESDNPKKQNEKTVS